MSDRGELTHVDLEFAIMDAEGASAVLAIIENKLTSSTEAGWKALRLEPREDLCVTALSPLENRALTYASKNLQTCVAEVARIFYATTT